MKKIASWIVVTFFSATCSATSNFSSSTGILVIPDVNADGSLLLDSVTLQLDFSNGTFKLLNYQPKNTKIADTPTETYTALNYNVGFLGCTSSGTNEITCYIQVVNNQADRKLSIYGNYSATSDRRTLLFDDLNNQYIASSVTVANKTDIYNIEATLIQGIPTKVSMVFKNIDTRAKSISAFKPAFEDSSTSSSSARFQGNFKNLKF